MLDSLVFCATLQIFSAVLSLTTGRYSSKSQPLLKYAQIFLIGASSDWLLHIVIVYYDNI
jgi:hypothetical protein